MMVGTSLALAAESSAPNLRGTGDLGIIVERASGRIKIIETTGRTAIGDVAGLGDLSHASAVFSRDGRYAFVFGRDGGLTKVDLLQGTVVKRVLQAGNSIGGAISQDGSLVAAANYEPGGVNVFDSETLAPVASIPALDASGTPSKVVGLEDAGDQRFVFSLYDAGEIWIADLSEPAQPKLTKFPGIGRLPYDALVTEDGRDYVAGLFGEDSLALLDLWHPEVGPRRILAGYGRGEEPLPVYKMPHLEGWARAGDMLFLPAIGRHEVLVVDTRSWREVGRIAVHGQPVFAVARPDGRQVWVNFAHPLNDKVQVIDVPSLSIVETLTLGPAVMHLEFTPRGEQVWISVRDEDRVDIYDTRTFAKLGSIPADKPSGIFLTARANRIGL
ncbi:MAG: cytochrome D1 domain-containing protein [Rhodospirillales bacterium]